MEFNIKEFDLNKFIEGYKEDLNYIYRSLKEEDLEDIVDILKFDDLSVIFNKDEIKEKGLKNSIDSGKYKVFFMLGGVCDDNETYFRFIDGIQYRIEDGECYEESSEHFHDYVLAENKIDLNNHKISIEDSIGFIIYREDEDYKVSMCNIDSDTSKGKVIENLGGFNEMCRKYLLKYKI